MTLRSGTTLGSYVIDALLGEGGMGAVYRAHDSKLQRSVAIKFLTKRATGADNQRILDEARAASALNHPHICTVYEVGEADGQSFIVMEHVDGRPLTEIIPVDGLPSATVKRYGVQVADALAHAHERRVVHRDLKAANILVTPEGRTKVLDFGLAERLKDETIADVTRSAAIDTGVIAGTLTHMAPEVLRGARADARSDVWALGVVLYQMASGRVPFERGSSYELVTAIVQDVPAALPPRAPAGIRSVIARCLEKEPGHRYQRASEVRAALELTDGAAVSGAEPHSGVTGARKPIIRTVGYAAAVALAAGILAGVWWIQRVPPRAPSSAARITSLAVIPLGNFSRDPEQEYFADGMTEALIASIAQIRVLRVTSRTSVMRYKGTTKSMPEIGRELMVDAVLEGSVMRSGDRVRITAQLIRASSDEHLWAETYDRDLKDVLALQGDVARAIARQIQINLTPQEEARLARARSVNPAAHEAYLKGRFYWYRRTTESLTRAIEFFQQAVQADPAYAPPYAGLAMTYLLLTNWDIASRPPRDLVPKSEMAAMKALQLDDALADAHAALANARLQYDWDWAAADREFKRAIELDNPTAPIARFWYGTCLAAAGRFDEAIAEAKRGQELDPLSAINNAGVSWMYHFARRDEDTIVHARKSLELDPEFAIGLGRLGVAYRHLGRLDEAAAILQRAATASSGSASSISQLALTYAAAGRTVEARDQLARLLRMSREGASVAFAVAIVYGGLADADQAFVWLERAYNERSGMMAFLTVEPDLDPLRSDPRFGALVKRVGLRR